MIRKHDDLNKQKYCYGNHHCPWHQWVSSPLLLIGCPDTPDETGETQHNTGECGNGWLGGLRAGRCKCVLNVRWPCPRTQWSVSGKGEGESFWPRCLSPSLGGVAHCLACTDPAPGACRRSCPEEGPSPLISAGEGVAWSGSPYRGCVSSRSVRAWWCLRRSRASGAAEEEEVYALYEGNSEWPWHQSR